MSVVAVSIKKKTMDRKDIFLGGLDWERRGDCARVDYEARGFTLYMFREFPQMYSFFFFQAEAGIRDLYVTGVQTCALPIFDHVAGALDVGQPLALGIGGHVVDRKSVVEGKSVDLGGRGISKKKKKVLD